MKKTFTKFDTAILNFFKKSHRIKIIVLIPSLFLLISCDYGHRSMNGSIEESKEVGVFVSEYKPLKNPVIINDSLKFRILACWLEK